MKGIFRYAFLAGLVCLTACSGGQPPKPGMKVGKPYIIEGKTYYPEFDPYYDKIGVASWYGPGFHGKYTANGEVFNENDLTAAHPTLPMPSLVRVTNLDNGKSLIVRVNDRGPFKANRIIDLSKKSAQELGVTSLAKVRVQYLKPETEQYLASLGYGGSFNVAAANRQEEARKNESVVRSTEPETQIVESTVATTSPADNVSPAAPVMMVDQGELQSPPPASPASGGLIRSAYANESAPPPAESRFRRENGMAYVVQAGAFSSEENAKKLVAKLAPVAPLAIEHVQIDGRDWWRVRTTNLSDPAMAEQALANIRAAGIANARITHQ